MKVHELIDVLKQCNPEAVVKVDGDDYFTLDGSRIFSDPVSIGWVHPTPRERATAKVIYLKKQC